MGNAARKPLESHAARLGVVHAISNVLVCPLIDVKSTFLVEVAM